VHCVVFVPGFQNEYTDKDALFLRKVAGATQAGQALQAQGLFSGTQPVNVQSPASVSVDYHDVYYDFNLRPYTFAPWFSLTRDRRQTRRRALRDGSE